ncbi:RAN GTPase-activating protein 1 [Diplonema papillatum]|nr:RAN GTPase-activating protein 1 [Diplonema papillatum]
MSESGDEEAAPVSRGSVQNSFFGRLGSNAPSRGRDDAAAKDPRKSLSRQSSSAARPPSRGAKPESAAAAAAPAPGGWKNIFSLLMGTFEEEEVEEAPKEEHLLHCLTPEELQDLAVSAFSKMYPNYQHPLSLVKRREHRLGFNIVDYKQAGRLPECPNREQYETTSTHGAVRHAFRISAFDEEKRFDFLCKQLSYGNRWGTPMPPPTGSTAQDLEDAVLRRKYCFPQATFIANFHNISLRPGTGRTVKIAGSLAFCKTILCLSLIGTGLTDSGLADLVSVLDEHPSLTRLNLQANKLGEKGAARLGDILRKNTTLRHVDVSLNDIGNAGTQAITSALLANPKSSVHYLNISTNRISAKGGFYLSLLIRDFPQLRYLVLWRNNLGVKPISLDRCGFDYLAEVLPTLPHLYHLDVSYNNITPASVQVLLDAHAKEAKQARVSASADFRLANLSDSESSSSSDESGSTTSSKWATMKKALFNNTQSSLGSTFFRAAASPKAAPAKPPPPRELPRRHLVITQGNDVDYVQQSALPKYYEIEPYTDASRVGKLPIPFGRKASWAAASPKAAPAKPPPPRELPRRHLVITQGNDVDYVQQSALPKYYEIEPYTDASRVGKQPIPFGRK